jgi:dTDP-4-amino-4,6-dideoxygalactose transaminase
MLGNYGSETKHDHSEIGFNSRLDTLQAIVLAAKLTRLAGWNALRVKAARHYEALLDEVPTVVTPRVLAGNEAVWHLYVVRVPDRDAALARLRASGIDAGVHYPIPIHRQRAFAGLSLPSRGFPVSERAAAEVLSLPIYPGITPEQQERVVATLKEAIG